MRPAVALAITLSALAATADYAQPRDLSHYFVGFEATFVLLNGRTGEYTRYNSERAAVRFPPCSTFKIPHTAILLETGAAPDPEYVIAYDPALKETNPAWARDQTLRSAFKLSVLWYYQALARKTGLDAERHWIHQFQYGNEDVSGGLAIQGSPFWVDGTLRISANEQVEFLKRLNEGRLGLSRRTRELTRDVTVAEVALKWTLRAKTGACQPEGEETANWYVGTIERSDGPYYFALEMGDKNFGEAFTQRVSKAREVLAGLGILSFAP